MGVVPLPPPAWMTRDDLIKYRDFLERQRRSLPFAIRGRAAFPTGDFLILLALLLPWLAVVGLKVLTGDWTLYVEPPHW